MSQKFTFSAPAFERYFMWCGIPRDEASTLVLGLTGAFSDEHPKLPLVKGTGSRHTPSSFIRLMQNGFGEMLAREGIDVSAFDCPDPYAEFPIPDEPRLSERIGEGDPIVLGLTGGRECGKSFLTNLLGSHDFVRVHPFNPGKALLRGYYVSRGASEAEALAMTDGSKHEKDAPAPGGVLPVDPKTGKNYTSRLVMERLGWFMANVVGLDSTIGRELAHWNDLGAERILVDSVVYEADHIREFRRSAIIRLDVPEESRGARSGIVADKTDEAVSGIVPDGVLINRMSGPGPLLEDLAGILESIPGNDDAFVDLAIEMRFAGASPAP